MIDVSGETIRNTDFVASLAKGMAVLGYLAATNTARSLSEVAEAVDLPRATARRLLLTLERIGYVESHGRGFALTAKVLQLGYGYFAANPLTKYIDAELEKVTSQTGNTSFASIYDQGEIILIGRQIGQFAEAPQVIGSRRPAYCTSMGRVFLSARTESEIKALLSEHPPKKLTPYTKTKKTEILAEIAKVRQHGYAVVENETTIGLRAVAVPVRTDNGEIVAAIDVVQIAQSEEKENAVKTNLPVLQAAVERLSDIANHLRLNQ